MTPSTDPRLNRLYARGPARIAFVDEAYATREKPFYAMSALVVDHADLDTVRDDLLSIVGDSYWHTSEALKDGSEDGKNTLKDIVDYLAASPGVTLCTVDSDPAHFTDIERVRAFTLSCLVDVLHTSHQVELVVMERRRAGAEETADNQTFSKLQADSRFRQMRFYQGTPWSEQILWAPDVIASTLRRRVVRGEAEWFEPIRVKTTIRRAGTFEQIVLP